MLTAAGNQTLLSKRSNTDNSKTGRTRSDLFKNEYLWAIDNFSFRQEPAGTPLESPVFTISLPDKDLEFIILLYPRGCYNPYCPPRLQGYISAYVKVLTKDIRVNAKVKLGIINYRGHRKELYKSPETSTTLAHHSTLGADRLVLKSYLFDVKSELLISSDDCLKVYCELSVVRERTVSVSYENFIDNIISRSLSEDFEELFENQKLSDFTLLVSGRTVQVHKAILAARSPVLADRLADSKTHLEINDDSYETVVELLRYIYTGDVKNIDDISQELLLASIKYQMEGLKKLCYRNIISKMDVTNGADCLKFAHENGLKELKDAALDFFRNHFKAIIKTEGFAKLKEAYPEIVLNDLFDVLM